jgi:1,6-anhydro-N-acetylmuramate kinase
MTDAVVRYAPQCTQPIGQVYLSGGGVRNGLLLRLIAAQWPDVSVSSTDEAGLPAELRQSVVAVAAALTLMACWQCADGNGGGFRRLLGSLTPGTAANWQRCLQWMSQHANTAAA